MTLRLVLFLAALAPATAFAQPMLIDDLGGSLGYGTDCLSPNDDGSSAAIDLTAAFPGGVEFFGRRHTTAFVNTNGNITFNGSLAEYTAEAFPVADQPMIAPYWADVDIRNVGGVCMGPEGESPGDLGCRNPANNGVWWHLSPGQMVVTWHRVGYFDCHTDKRMTFQLILSNPRLCGIPGDFDVEFRYTNCAWETGDASDGVGGFGGTEAQVGFDAGNTIDFLAIPGSLRPGISDVVCMESNVGRPGVWRFRIRRGVVECPDAGEHCDIPGMVGACGDGRTACSGTTGECLPIVGPTSERCDAVDNDCDGMVDETSGGPLCSASEVCDRGGCIPPCFEGGCAAGETCDPTTMVCYEDACRDVTCAEGERCLGGACTAVCDGVVCPDNQACVAGRCAEVCQNVTCGPCERCERGDCVPRCEVDGCPTGQSCEEDGVCVVDACLGVRCGPARTCMDGFCADSCIGVTCPAGLSCYRAECVPPDQIPDAGPPDEDAGVDGGPVRRNDAGGPMDAGPPPDAGGPPMNGGCGCRATGAPASTRLALLLLFFGLVLVVRRRKSASVLFAACITLAAGCETMTVVDDGCGDGVVLIPELCDDGNTMGGDGCSADCLDIEMGWRCFGMPSTCDMNIPASCGDFRLDVGEQCDDGGQAPECDDDCTIVMCGDANVNEQAGELCDDGNTEDGDGCAARCEIEPPTCGDGECDLGGETCTNCVSDCGRDPACTNCVDVDGDGEEDQACGGMDCNDEDAAINSGATEVPCNRIDEDCSPATRDALDADMDSSTCNFDCDDADPERSPLYYEACNDGRDNDCNDGTPDVADLDGDGSSCMEDCDDHRATTCPTCPELCDNTFDDDCNAATPDDGDLDMDGTACSADCDDANPAVHPGADEVCANMIDDDCRASTMDVFDGDRDGDMCNVDCDDADPLRASTRREVCDNGRDDDCDDMTPEVIGDYDMDGSPCNVDCNDADMTIVPDSVGRCGPRTMYFEDFEAGNGGWTASGTRSSWAHGVPNTTFIPRAASGTRAWVTNLTGSYMANEMSYLTSPRFDFSAIIQDPVLSFSHIYRTEACCDEGWVEISLDGGTTWRKLGRNGEGANWYNDAGNQWWDGNSGAAGAWRTASIPLTGVAGLADVRIRFVFSSDGSAQDKGFGIDDVSVDNQRVDLELVSIALGAEVCAANRPITMRVRNNSAFTFPAYQASFTIDGGTPVTETVMSALPAGATLDVPFTAPADLTAVGAHTVVVSVSISGDAVPTNDTRMVMFDVLPTIVITSSTPYVESFETGAGDWEASGTNFSWNRGIPNKPLIPAAADGTAAWVTNLTGNYNNNERSYLTSPCFDLSAVTSTSTMSFRHIFQTQSSDILDWYDASWMEVQQSDGTWTRLGISGTGSGGVNWYNSTRYTPDRWEGSSGASGVWRTASHPLFGTAGRNDVRIRFYFESSGSGTFAGFGVDDFRITP